MSVDVALSVEGQRAQHSAAPGAPALPVGSDGEVGHGGDGGCELSELSELSELQQLEQECQEPEMSHGKNGKIEIARCIVCVLLRPIRARDRQKYSIGLNRTCQVRVLRCFRKRNEMLP